MELQKLKLTFSESIHIKAHFEKHLDVQLDHMEHFFVQHMWNGYSEDVGQFVSDDDHEALEALMGKIKHMILNIGCPLSVGDMLHSISQRKIKYWGSHYSYKNHGKQLKNKADRVLLINEGFYEYKKGDQKKNEMVDKGHFRWNWRAYTFSRVATDVLSMYMEIHGF
jgi:hypothetical protein